MKVFSFFYDFAKKSGFTFEGWAFVFRNLFVVVELEYVLPTQQNEGRH
jgi:hypothetical protein